MEYVYVVCDFFMNKPLSTLMKVLDCYSISEDEYGSDKTIFKVYDQYFIATIAL